MSSGFVETGLSVQAMDVHRSLASLQEELEAIDFYHQRADVTHDEALKAVLIHNRDDEMEHAAMLLEGLRRTMPAFDVQLKKFLFTSCPLAAPAASGAGLGLGRLNQI